MAQDQDKIIQGLISVINKLILVIVVLVVGIIAMPFIINYRADTKKEISKTTSSAAEDTVAYWAAADINTIADRDRKSVV